MLDLGPDGLFLKTFLVRKVSLLSNTATMFTGGLDGTIHAVWFIFVLKYSILLSSSRLSRGFPECSKQEWDGILEIGWRHAGVGWALASTSCVVPPALTWPGFQREEGRQEVDRRDGPTKSRFRLTVQEDTWALKYRNSVGVWISPRNN